MNYNTLFFTPSPHTVVDTLDEFFALPHEQQVYTTVSDRGTTTFPIHECHEPMVTLATYLPQHQSDIVLVAGEAALGAQSLDTHRLRVGAAERLLKAEQTLKSTHPTLTFKITDSYRPIALQKIYFDRVYAHYSASGLTGDELYRRVIQGIADPECHPPHCTGGTLDLTLFDTSIGQALDLGNVLDDVDDVRSNTFNTTITDKARQNRILLYTAMIEAGFVNAPSEWWHYTYGTQEWAIRTGNDSAIYDTL